MKILLFILLTINLMITAQVNFSNITLEEAIVLAKSNHKNILIDVYTDWCLPCKQLDKHIFQDSIISKYLNQYYISFRLNAESDYGQTVSKELNILEAYPTVLLLKADGNEIDRITGLFDKEEYFQTIKDYTSNINTFNKLLKIEKDENLDISIREQIAKKYFERGLVKKASEHYKHLVKIDKYNSNGMIYFMLARCYSRIKMNKEANEYVSLAIKKDSSNIYYNRLLKTLNSK